jgi:hypothetical protein
MHRTLRPPAAKVAPARPTSTWKVRRGRGRGPAGGGIVCGVPFCSPMCGSTRRFLRAFYLNSEHKGAAPGRARGRSPARGTATRSDTLADQVRPRDETRPGTPRDLRPRSNSHTSAHVDARDLHTVATDMQVAYHSERTRRTATKPAPTTINSRPQPWDNRTVVSTSVSVTPQARTGHPASK